MKLSEAQDIVQAVAPHDYYEKHYRGFEKDYLQHIVNTLPPPMVQKRRVLDIGPGWGTMMVLMSSWGWDVTVMDIEERGTFLSDGLLTLCRAAYVKQDVLEKPLDSKFDVILCTQVLLHLKYNMSRALINIRDMLAEDGVALLTVLDPECYPKLDVAFPLWARVPEYRTAPAHGKLVTCVIGRNDFEKLLRTVFNEVGVCRPQGSTVLLAECRGSSYDGRRDVAAIGI